VLRSIGFVASVIEETTQFTLGSDAAGMAAGASQLCVGRRWRAMKIGCNNTPNLFNFAEGTYRRV
jgi:hypothetical protein